MFSREGRKQGGFLVIKDHKHDRSSSTEGEFVGLIITVVYPDAQKQYVRQIPWLYMEIDVFSVALLSKRETIRMCPCHACHYGEHETFWTFGRGNIFCVTRPGPFDTF